MNDQQDAIQASVPADAAAMAMGRRLRTTGVIAACLFFVDAFVLNQGIIALGAAAIVIFILIPRILLARYRNDRDKATLLAWKAAIYTLMAVAVWATNYGNNQIARQRADMLIEACRRFEAEHHRLPAQLEELVPEFAPEVPVAKYTLSPTVNRFSYITTSSGRHLLFYVDLPPFGRPTYSFETGQWDYVD